MSPPVFPLENYSFHHNQGLCGQEQHPLGAGFEHPHKIAIPVFHLTPCIAFRNFQKCRWGERDLLRSVGYRVEGTPQCTAHPPIGVPPSPEVVG